MKQKIQLMGLYAVVMMCVSTQLVFGAAATADHNKFLTDYVQRTQITINGWNEQLRSRNMMQVPAEVQRIKNEVADVIEGLQNNLAIAQYEQLTTRSVGREQMFEIWKKQIEEQGLTFKKSFISILGNHILLYIFVDSQKMLGRITSVNVKDDDLKKLSEQEKKIVAGQYKIHLMPTDDTIDKVFKRLLVLINNNTQLCEVIKNFKIYAFYGATGTQFEQSKKLLTDKGKDFEGNVRVLPRIVIYCADGKANAQRALNILYEAFKGVEGMNIAPRFNTRVTSLIYVAQGDGDYKFDSLNDEPLNNGCYELSENASGNMVSYKVYYDPEFITPEDGKTHHLIHPEKTDKELVPKPEMFAE